MLNRQAEAIFKIRGLLDLKINLNIFQYFSDVTFILIFLNQWLAKGDEDDTGGHKLIDDSCTYH